MIGGRPWPEVGEMFQQSGGGHLLESVDPPDGVEGEGGGEMEQEEGVTVGGGRGGGTPSSTAATTGSTGTATASTVDVMPPALQQLPDTIDSDVLAALPDHIQQEILAQHAREQRARQAQREGFTTSISPEFLSALPPNIQEEVSFRL